MPTQADLEVARQLLCKLQDAILQRIVDARREAPEAEMHAVSHETQADTIYQIDTLSEAAIMEWFASHWPAHWPVELVMEGLEEEEATTFPQGTPVSETIWTCIIDPIDGTREIMYDKRSAWALTGLAPQKGAATCLSDILVAVMTELPTSKQWRADQISAIRGLGCYVEAINVYNQSRLPIQLRPSTATDLNHGWASIVKFFPEGKGRTAQFEEDLWKELLGANAAHSLIFDDQYLCTGGQYYEILSGHDRFLGDLRPLLFDEAAHKHALFAKPYDACCALILEEAGCIIETPTGSPLRAPLDTSTPIAWVAYANTALADKLRPLLQKHLARHCPQSENS